MKKNLSSGRLRVILFLAVFAIGVGISYKMLNPTKSLPIYQPADINPRLVDTTLQGQKENHHILDFTLTSQLGEAINLSKLKGKIIVADFFFTTCPSICPKMTKQLNRVAEKFASQDNFLILSHTVDPETDDVATLKAYGELHNIKPEKWLMLTGPSKTIYKLARKSYFAVLDEPSTEGPDFVHTENFVLVDAQGRLRGFYDGTNTEEVNKLITDIELLLNEPNN